jgi:hypothetical protein
MREEKGATHSARGRGRLYLEPPNRETRHHLVCEQHPRRNGGLAAGRSLQSGRAGEFLPYPSSLARPHSAHHGRAAVLGIPLRYS